MVTNEWETYLYFHPFSSDLMGIVMYFLSLKVTSFPALGSTLGKTKQNAKKPFLLMKVTSDQSPSSFFSLDEESIGPHLLAKLMWFRAIEDTPIKSNFIQFLEQHKPLEALGPLHVLSLSAWGGVCFPHTAHLRLVNLYSPLRLHSFRELFCGSHHPSQTSLCPCCMLTPI